MKRALVTAAIVLATLITPTVPVAAQQQGQVASQQMAGGYYWTCVRNGRTVYTLMPMYYRMLGYYCF